MERTHERVPFRFLVCPACKHQMCWINPRLPNYCPECGEMPPGMHQGWRERVFMRDDEAILTLHNAQPLAGGTYVEEAK